MKDRKKTEEQLVRELAELRRRIAELEAMKAEDAPRESHAEFHSVLDSAPLAMVLVDSERRVQWANRSALEFIGHPFKTIQGRRGGEALRCIHAVDDERGCGFGHSCEKCEIRRMLLETLETNQTHRRVLVELRTSPGEDEDVLSLLVSTIPCITSGSRMVLVCLDDVTRLKQAEEALKRSEERYALAQRAAGIGSWDWDIVKGALFWSESIEPLFGFARGEFGATYEAFLECVHPEDRQSVIDSVNACLQDGAKYAIEHRIVRPDGTERWVSEAGDVIQDEMGKATRMLGIVQDITDRRKAQEDARDLSKFPSENPNPVLRISRDGTILYANKASAKLLRAWKCGIGAILPEEWGMRVIEALASGAKKNEEFVCGDQTLLLTFAPVVDANYVNIYGLDITDRKRAEVEIGWLAKFPSENPNPVLRVAKDGTLLYANKSSMPLLDAWGCRVGQPLPDVWRTFTAEVFRAGSSKETECTYKDRILSLSFTPVVEADYVNVYGLDITDRKRAEENARAQSEFVRRIIESLPHPFYVIDVHDYTVKMANPAAVQGTLPPHTTCHSLTHDSPTPCNTTAHPCPVQEIRKTKKPRIVEHLHRDTEGAERTVEVHCYPIFDREENVVEIIEYAMDVTERKKAAEAERLKRLSEMLINFQEEERRRVARDLHDELGQVLTAIKLTLGMILKDHPELDDEIREELEETVSIMDSAMRFTRTISTRLRPEMLDSLGLIPSIEHEVAFAEKRSGMRIRCTGPGLRTRLDPQKEITLYRVVQEALNNIFKHAEASEAEVSIGEEDGAVLLQVRDNGRGVEDTDIETSRGLGVLGMRERIASVGGTLTIRSRPGGGTVLEAVVPIRPATKE